MTILDDTLVADWPGVQRNFEAVDSVFRSLGLGRTGGDVVKLIREALIPTGTVLATARSAAPSGFLLCDGASLLRTDYPDLFAAIGTTYGSVDGTHFTLPDLRGRVPAGEDGAAARLTANDALGQSAGEEKHTLLTSEIPNHSHTIAGSNNIAKTGFTAQVAAGAAFAAVNATAGKSTTETDGGGASPTHNNMQPYQIVNYMVKI